VLVVAANINQQASAQQTIPEEITKQTAESAKVPQSADILGRFGTLPQMRHEGKGDFIRIVCSADGKKLVGVCNKGIAQQWEIPECKASAPFRCGEIILAAAFPPPSEHPWFLHTTKSRDKVFLHIGGKDRLLLTIDPEQTPLEAAALSSDGKWFATVGTDHVMHVWETANGNERTVCAGHKGTILAIEFDEKGRRAATASKDKTVRAWDLETGKVLVTANISLKGGYPMALSPDGVTLAIQNGVYLDIWNVDNAKKDKSYYGECDRPLKAALST
jgi:WD40 repeat protein